MKIDKILLKSDCIDGSIINGVREPILFSFASHIPTGFNFFVKWKQYILKKDKSVVNSITFYLEEDPINIVIINGDTCDFYFEISENLSTNTNPIFPIFLYSLFK